MDGDAQVEAPAAGTGAEVRVKPDGGKLVRQAGWATFVSLGVGVMALRYWGAEIALVGWAALTTVSALAHYVAYRNDALFAGPGYFGRVTWWGRTKRYPLSELVAVIRVGVNAGRSGTIPIWIIYGHNGRIMKLDDRMWADSKLNAIWKRMGVEPQGSFDDVISGWSLNDQYPKGPY